MYIPNNKQYHEAITKQLNLNTQSEIQPEPSKSHPINIPEVDISWVGGFSFVAISWASAFFLLSKLLKSVQDPATLKLNLLHQLPCKNCKYFCNNHYLKCAVQPDIVMTEQARNCCDYCPNNGKNPQRKLEIKK
jgi:hypothetical protein